MHPRDVAGVVRALPLAQRRQLAEAMDDERLADLLEELPEAEQLRLIEGLDLDRLVDVLDEMEYDDLADLLGEMPGEQRTRILEAMDAEDADVVRRLLTYEEGTAGGMMTPELIMLGPTATVAEALAQIRDPDWVVSIAAQVFVCQPPFKAPTGASSASCTSSGCSASRRAWSCADASSRTRRSRPTASDREVAELLAQLRHARPRGVRRGRAICSARSPSTTCSTAQLGDRLAPAQRRRDPRPRPDEDGGATW